MPAYMIQCPACRGKFDAPLQSAHTVQTCPNCGKRFKVLPPEESAGFGGIKLLILLVVLLSAVAAYVAYDRFGWQPLDTPLAQNEPKSDDAATTGSASGSASGTGPSSPNDSTATSDPSPKSPPDGSGDTKVIAPAPKAKEPTTGKPSSATTSRSDAPRTVRVGESITQGKIRVTLGGIAADRETLKITLRLENLGTEEVKVRSWNRVDNGAKLYDTFPKPNRLTMVDAEIALIPEQKPSQFTIAPGEMAKDVLVFERWLVRPPAFDLVLPGDCVQASHPFKMRISFEEVRRE